VTHHSTSTTPSVVTTAINRMGNAWVTLLTLLLIFSQVVVGNLLRGGGNESYHATPPLAHRVRVHATDSRGSGQPSHSHHHRSIERKRDGSHTRMLQFEELGPSGGGGVSKALHHNHKKHHNHNIKNNNNYRQSTTTTTTVTTTATKLSRSAAALSKAAESILLEADRYHMWWTGPPSSNPLANSFGRANWSIAHNPLSTTAVFSMAFLRSNNDNDINTVVNDVNTVTAKDLIRFLGSLRRVCPEADIVLAIDANHLLSTSFDTIRRILLHFRATVYLLPPGLCVLSSSTTSSSTQQQQQQQDETVLCGSMQEQVPASVFRYFFFEKWAAQYATQALVLVADLRDVIFQSDPFARRLMADWFPESPLAVFQEFYPNMVIARCRLSRQVLGECYGDEALRQLGGKSVISSGAVLGSRDAMLVWTHFMTLVNAFYC
jgi:hypothetical protein